MRCVEVKSAGAVMEKADAPASGRVVSAPDDLAQPRGWCGCDWLVGWSCGVHWCRAGGRGCENYVQGLCRGPNCCLLLLLRLGVHLVPLVQAQIKGSGWRGVAASHGGDGGPVAMAAIEPPPVAALPMRGLPRDVLFTWAPAQCSAQCPHTRGTPSVAVSVSVIARSSLCVMTLRPPKSLQLPGPRGGVWPIQRALDKHKSWVSPPACHPIRPPPMLEKPQALPRLTAWLPRPQPDARFSCQR